MPTTGVNDAGQHHCKENFIQILNQLVRPGVYHDKTSFIRSEYFQQCIIKDVDVNDE